MPPGALTRTTETLRERPWGSGGGKRYLQPGWNGIEAAWTLRLFEGVLSPTPHPFLSVFDVAQKEKLRDENKNRPHYVFRLFEPNGGQCRSAGTWPRAPWVSSHTFIVLYIPRAAHGDHWLTEGTSDGFHGDFCFCFTLLQKVPNHQICKVKSTSECYIDTPLIIKHIELCISL